MIINFEGRRYDFDVDRISVGEFREVKRKYKMTVRQWQEALTDIDPDALTVLYWLMLRQDGQQNEPLGDHLDFPLATLAAAFAAAEEDAPEEADPLDPTRGSSSPAASPAPPAANHHRKRQEGDAPITVS